MVTDTNQPRTRYNASSPITHQLPTNLFCSMFSAHFDSIFHSIQGWAQENTERIEKACMVNGGWEEWAQIELVLYINSLYGSLVSRKVYPYERFDLHIHSLLGSALVGLKCRFGSEETVHDGIFVESMLEDVEKINSMDDFPKDFHFFVVGLIRGEDSMDRVRRLLQKRANKYQNWEAVEAVDDSDIWILALYVYEGAC